MASRTKLWLLTGSLFGAWYAMNPSILPSRFPVATTAGTQTMPGVVEWTRWLFSSGSTGKSFWRWLNYEHPTLPYFYGGLLLLVVGSPFIYESLSRHKRVFLDRPQRIAFSRHDKQDENVFLATDAKNRDQEDRFETKDNIPSLPPLVTPDQTFGGLRVFEQGFQVDNPFGGAKSLEDRWRSSTEAERSVPNFIKIIQARSSHYTAAAPVSPESVTALVGEFPNFKEVLDFIAGYCAAGKVGTLGFMSFPPILLVGPPGIGKTELCNRLGEVLHIPVENIGLGGNSGGAMILGGMNSGWRGSAPGHVALVLATTGVVNPLFLLDEVDKVPTDSSSVSSVTSYLLSALEKTSAKKLMDEFLGPSLPFDASRLLWVAAANKLEPIPEPLLSRFNVFHVKNIPEDKMPPVIRAITVKTLKDLGLTHVVHVNIQESGIQFLAKKPPRAIKKLVQTVILETVRKSSSGSLGFQNIARKIIVDISEESLQKHDIGSGVPNESF